MADNPLKAVVDAIAESDNEIGGLLITRLRAAIEYGRDNASVAAADADRLVSPVDVFSVDDVGMGVAVLEAAGGANGNEGDYIVDNYVDPKNVDLVKIGDGAAATFVDESDVRWRFTTLKVETTLGFPSNDRALGLWVGDEAVKIPYAELVDTPGSQEVRGIGPQSFRLDGVIEAASPTTIKTVGEFFTSDMVGRALWVLPQSSPTGNEGPRRIATFVDAREVTIAGAALSVDEEDVRLVVKSYDRLGDGYLTKRGSVTYHREMTEIIDASQSYSAIDQLRRALFVEYAEGDELDRVGRNLGLKRARTMGDEDYRRFVKARAYLPATTIEAFEIILEALFPEGGYSVYEDLVSNPNKVYLLDLPTAAPSADSEGKAILASSGEYPPNESDIGARGTDKATSTSATSVTVTHEPIEVVTVELDDVDIEHSMSVLPSAATPAWTYVAEGAGAPAEGTIFSVGAVGEDAAGATVNALHQVMDAPPSRNGGRYQYDIVEMDDTIGSFVDFSVWHKITDDTDVSAHPFHIGVEDDAIDRSYYIHWNNAEVIVGQADQTDRLGGAITPPAAKLGDGGYHHFRIRRESRIEGHVLLVFVDGAKIAEVNLSTFSTTTAKRFSFGFIDNGSNANFTCDWGGYHVFARCMRNYYNLRRYDGDFAGAGSDDMTSAAALFVAGDTGKRIRIRSTNLENEGLWSVTYSAAGTITLSGIKRERASVLDGDDIVTIDDPWFNGLVVGKSIVISGSGSNNNGTYPILAWGGANGNTGVDVSLTEKQVRVDVTGHPDGTFNTETGLTWEYDTAFVAESSVEWELVDASSFAAAVLTLRDSLPATNQPVRVWYDVVLSAQVLRNEFESNQGSGGAEPNIFYPFYLFDVDSETRRVLDDVSAAGVIPYYKREF